jgi:ribonuclease VapC
MVLDTSSIVAVLLRQSDAAVLHRLLLNASPSMVGAPTLAEAGIVLQARLGPAGLAALRSFVVEYDVHVLAFGDEHWRVAAQAFGMFGKGRHSAGLNYGDCLTYAAAKLAGEPLLCLGEDFPQTDLELVPLP